MLLRHSFDIVELKIQRMGYRDFQLRDKIWNCDAVTCHTVVWPTYHDQKSVSLIILTFRKNIIKEKKLQG